MLKLPSYQQLSREQDVINNLPLTASHLIIGPPGTGKTVMAIYRASMFRKKNKNTNFLIFNRTLMQYLEQATREVKVDSVATTFHRWFYAWYRQNFHCEAPMVAPHIFDWGEVITNVFSHENSFEQYDHIIVDEGQDFPKDFYMLIQLLSKNITVFADENQRIQEQHSTIKDIQNYLNTKQIYKLTKNYRNTRPIAEFAREFYAGLQSGIPDLPAKNGPKPRALHAHTLSAQIDYIARYEQNNAEKDIAIFVPRNNQQYIIAEMLSRHKLLHRPQLYVHNNEDFKALDFRSRGIKILTYASAKGLEFDTVFLPELEKHTANPNSDLEKMRFYVLVSRAREELFMLFSSDTLPPIIQRISQNLFDLENI